MDKTFGSARAIVLRWSDHGFIPPERLREALSVTGVIPDRPSWQRFLDRVLLGSGTMFLAAAAIFFIAANWSALGRFTKFGLAEALVALGVLAFCTLGPNTRTAKAALLFTSMALGGLLALYGQTYQTGADTWQLFGTWALLMLPWVIVGQFAALWMLWLIVMNVALFLYFMVVPSLFGLAISEERQLWSVFVLNAVALVVWELAARRLGWLDGRWAPRLLSVASGSLVTALAIGAIAGGWDGMLIGTVYAAWFAGIVAIYRGPFPDLFMIAGTCLSLIVIVPVFFATHWMKSADAGGMLFIGLVVIGMSAASAFWLRTLAQESHS